MNPKKINIAKGPFDATQDSFIQSQLINNKIVVFSPVESIVIRLNISSVDKRLFYYFPLSNSIWLSAYDIDTLKGNSILTEIVGYIKQGYVVPSGVLIQTIKIALAAKCAKFNNIYYAEYMSRGPFTHHFGHFCVDFLPYYDLFIELGRTCENSLYLGSSNLTSWQVELITILEMDNFEYKNILFPEDKRITFNCLDAVNCRVKFIKMSQAEKVNRTQNELNMIEYPKHINFPGRGGALPEHNIVVFCRRNNKRWINPESCLHIPNSNVKLIYPEDLGPTQLNELLDKSKANLVISAIGSAIYQLFYMRLQLKVLCLYGNLNCEGTWESLVKRNGVDSFFELEPFINYIYLGYRSSSITQAWNSTFETTSQEVSLLSQYVLGKSQELPATLSIIMPKSRT